jgi:hypothetical protein
MHRHEAQPQTEDDREKRPSDLPPSRGNPDTDREAVDRGEEQLEKVSGN